MAQFKFEFYKVNLQSQWCYEEHWLTAHIKHQKLKPIFRKSTLKLVQKMEQTTFPTVGEQGGKPIRCKYDIWKHL